MPSDVRKSPFIHIVLICLVGLIVYSNTFHVPFQFDEHLIIEDNPVVKDLGYFIHPSKAQGLGLHYYNLKDRYMGFLSFALNYKFHGTGVTGYHIVNLALHLLNSVFVYLLVALTLRTPFLSGSCLKGYTRPIALFSALLFVCHPIQTEAVTYIVRFAILVSFFYLGSLLFYAKWRLTPLSSPGIITPPSPPLNLTPLSSHLNLRGDRDKNNPLPRWEGIRGRVILYLLSLLFALFAMKTKENAFTLPFIIVLYEFFFFPGKDTVKRRLIYLFPFILALLVIPLSHLYVGGPADDMMGEKYSATRHYSGVSRADYLITQFRVIATYIRLLFLPVNQNLDYYRPVIHSFFNLEVMLSFLFLLMILLSGIYFYRRSKVSDASLRILSFGIFWFFITLSIESSIFPIPMIMCEYRVYLPSVGFFTAISAVFFRFAPKNGRYREAFIALPVIVIVVLSAAAYKRNALWKDVGTLWEDVVKKSPWNARAHTKLALYYEGKGFPDEAKKHAVEALRLDPGNAEAHLNVANLYRTMGIYDLAIKHYQTALSRTAGQDTFFLSAISYKAHYSLGIVYTQTGRPDLAEGHYLEAIRLRPDFLDGYNNLGTLYLQTGKIDSAIEKYKEALRVDPACAESYYNLGISYAAKEQIDLSISNYEESIRLKPAYPEALNNLAAVYMGTGYLDKAIELYSRAVSLKTDPLLHYNLGRAYEAKGLKDLAKEQFSIAERLKGNITR